MSEPQIIYFTAPMVVRDTDRYELRFYQVSHHFVGAELLEAKELFSTMKAWRKAWKAVLARIDVLVFMRNEERCVGQGTFSEIVSAVNAGKQVYLARQNRDGGELVLVPWEKLSYKLNKADKKNYAKIEYARPQKKVDRSSEAVTVEAR